MGVTQTELAKATRLSRSLIAKAETGRVMPSYEKAKLIFDTLEAMEKGAKASLRGITLGQICSRQIEHAEAEEALGEVWRRMESRAFSQLPVRGGDGRVIGGVTERSINRALMAGDPAEKRGMLVSSIMEEPFPILPAETPVAAIIDLLQQFQAVLVQESGTVIGIATNIDVGKVFGLLKR